MILTKLRRQHPSNPSLIHSRLPSNVLPESPHRRTPNHHPGRPSDSRHRVMVSGAGPIQCRRLTFHTRTTARITSLGLLLTYPSHQRLDGQLLWPNPIHMKSPAQDVILAVVPPFFQCNYITGISHYTDVAIPVSVAADSGRFSR